VTVTSYLEFHNIRELAPACFRRDQSAQLKNNQIVLNILTVYPIAIPLAKV